MRPRVRPAREADRGISPASTCGPPPGAGARERTRAGLLAAARDG
jgi:hypothetical protein